MKKLATTSEATAEETGRLTLGNLVRSGARLVGGIVVTGIGITIALEPCFDSFISDEGAGSPIARVIAGTLVTAAGISLALSPSLEQEKQV